ncbi:uncharacterized protein DSM5745_08511 [Aspergillus mulundensis]|uniref:Uncharacterized protein n=1 Tax=Aspergillus mulundensis TaxID=1810919 RepID=A0A3D8R497_9EURO|nr:hypothetical protein DSM5745_08511 [Aspergillus mulundensis]RDW68751.1 hypothetical protein DSM5745_08511 [Aspergillus mulundensis]
MFGFGTYTLALGRNQHNWFLVLIYPSESKVVEIAVNASPTGEYQMNMVEVPSHDWHLLRRNIRFQTVARLSPNELATCLVPCFDQTEPGPQRFYIIRLLRRLASAPYGIGSLRLVDEIQRAVGGAAG